MQLFLPHIALPILWWQLLQGPRMSQIIHLDTFLWSRLYRIAIFNLADMVVKEVIITLKEDLRFRHSFFGHLPERLFDGILVTRTVRFVILVWCWTDGTNFSPHLILLINLSMNQWISENHNKDLKLVGKANKNLKLMILMRKWTWDWKKLVLLRNKCD